MIARLVLTAALAAAPRAAAAQGKPNIVLVVVDALRADHLSGYGYARRTSPRLDALAFQGAAFTQAIAQAPWTLPALSSIMTSLYPSVHGAVALPADPDWERKLAASQFVPGADQALSDRYPTLAALLRDGGYRTIGVVSGGLCRSAFGFGRGFDEYFNEGGRLEELNRLILPKLEAGGGRPFFLYVHAGDVHAPYGGPAASRGRWDPDYRGSVDGSRAALRAALSGERRLDRRDLEHLVALYDAGVSYTDEQIGALLDALERLKLAERTLVVVTADHGEEFGEHGGLTHGDSLYDEVLRVPLILRGPGVPAGRRVKAQVRSIDIAPTLLDYAGLARPAGLQGQSLRPWLDGTREDDLEAFSEQGGSVAVRALGWKLISGAGGERLFDLARDPAETADRSAGAAGLRRRLEAALASWRKANRAAARRGRPARAALDPSTREKLRASGYLK